ncbi:peptidase domain-containing ABC transporter [Leisingera daeponensis]|uniref:peptidase domain-containing ABC transporter n=1 Tax=Leisingera daeponensis TaxID=405746 RepID=UPI001C949C66|nr:ATP-binding cassette domain-containing protein [Leisingera daeponensis]MBY6058652.1 ATP-binding cassette domain-containing protein [Leisingera daeponensis]
MNAQSPAAFAEDPALSSFGLDAIADSIDTSQCWGVTSKDPVIAAAFRILGTFGWTGSRDNFVRALPHFPDRLTAEDLRSILLRLGILSTESQLGNRGVEDLPPAAALVTSTGRILVARTDTEGGCRLVDPVTGQRCSEGVTSRTLVLSFSKPSQTAPGGFVRRLITRFRQNWLHALAAKTASNFAALAITFGVIAVYDAVIPAGAHDTLAWLGAGLAMLLLLDMGIRRLKARSLARIAARMEFLVSTTVVRKIISLPLQNIMASPVSTQVVRIRQFSRMATLLAGGAADTLADLPFVLLTVAAIFAIAGPLGFVPVCLMLCFGLFAAVLVPRLRRAETATRSAAEEENRITSDLFQNAVAIRCAGEQRAWRDRLETVTRRKAIAGRSAEMAQSAIDAVCKSATPVSGGLTALFGAYLVMQGNLSSGALLGAVMLTWRAIAPVQSAMLLATKWTEIAGVASQLDRLAALRQEHDPKRVHHSYSAKGDIQLNAVGFRYSTKSAPALRGLSTRIPEGALVAITGPSAAGKSTFLRLVAGLLQPQTGVLTINGVNASQIPVSQLRQFISYVPAQPVLVHGSVAQNLRLACPFATEPQMFEILDELSLRDAVGKLPEGIHTVLTDQVQATLPSGFRQSLAVAQALLRDPQVLLLDDPAQSLDRTLEAAMIEAIQRRQGRVTTLMVTHRPSHIRLADLELPLLDGMPRPTRRKKEHAA